MKEKQTKKCSKCIYFCYGEEPYKCALYKKVISKKEKDIKTDCISFKGTF